MINCFKNPHASILSDKWLFDSSWNWETFALDIKSFNIDDIADKTFRALEFHISTTGYLEKWSLCFTNVTDLELSVKPAVVDNLGEIITDFEEEIMKKKNKRVFKKKERLTKLCALFRSFLSPCLESTFLLLLCFVPAHVPTFRSAPMPAPVSYPRSPAILSSGYVPALAASTAFSSPHHFLIFYYFIPVFLLTLSVLDLPFLSLSLKTFKQFLSDEP